MIKASIFRTFNPVGHQNKSKKTTATDYSFYVLINNVCKLNLTNCGDLSGVKMIQNKPFLIVFLIIILCFSLLMLGLRFKKEDFSRLVYGVFRSSFIAQFRHNNYQTDYYKKKGREVERW
ncbi:hypothetical protein [Crocosphaera watsonii]|nr:hypothetical protein [Crocosphaera watsonii]